MQADPTLQQRLAHGQRGVTLIVALVVLVLMTLAAIGLMRSNDTTNLIAGNLAFKQAATLSADPGVETAIAWLEANNTGAFLDVNAPQVGYTASSLNNGGLPLGEGFWNQMSASGVCNLPMAGGVCSVNPVADAAGNTASFMIQRLCNAAGNRNGAGCAVVAGGVNSSGNNEGAGEVQLTAGSNTVFYRITVRVIGPRNSASYVQAIVSM